MNDLVDPNGLRNFLVQPSASLPDLFWSIPGAFNDPPARQSQGAGASVSSADLTRWVNQLLRGSEGEIQSVAEYLLQARVRAVVPYLVQIADGSLTKDRMRRSAAILLLGQLGGPDVIQRLTALKKTPEYGPQTCFALGCLGHPAALPYLIELLREGYPIRLNFSLSPEEEHFLDGLAHAYALVAVGLIGDASAIPYLILEANREYRLYFSLYKDEGGGLSKSSNLGLALIGGISDYRRNKDLAGRTSSIVVEPGAALSSVMRFPGDTRMAWMLQLRVSMIKILARRHGAQFILDSLPHAREAIDRLMAALALLDFEVDHLPGLNILVQVMQSKNKVERILAYDGFVRHYVSSKNERSMGWAARGLSDGDAMVRGAVAASILFNRMDVLFPHVFALLKAAGKEERTAMLVPLFSLAMRGDSRAISTLQGMLMSDPDRIIRELVAPFLKDLPAIQQDYAAKFPGNLEAQPVMGSATPAEAGFTVLDEITPIVEPPAPVVALSVPAIEPATPLVVSHGPAVEPPTSVVAQRVPVVVPPVQAVESPAPVSPVLVNRFCMYCRFELPEKAEFCPGCGKKIPLPGSI